MKEFAVVLQLTVIQETTVTLRAETEDQAREQALSTVHDYNRYQDEDQWDTVDERDLVVVGVREVPPSMFLVPVDMFQKVAFTSDWTFVPAELQDFMQKHQLTLRLSVFDQRADGLVSIRLQGKDVHGEEVTLACLPEFVELMAKNGGLLK